MKVLITGATGATGTEAARALLGKGIDVRAYVHNSTNEATSWQS